MPYAVDLVRLVTSAILAQSENRLAIDAAGGFSHRIAGVGSLGRPRYVATGCGNGGFVAREAKAWLPSAWGWAKGRPKEHAYSVRLLKQSVREPDPYYSVQDGWVVRRLGPHCGRIELTEFPKQRDEHLILKDMGRETCQFTPGDT